MLLTELEIDLPVVLTEPNALAQIREALRFRLPRNATPLRFAVSKFLQGRISCTVSTVTTPSAQVSIEEDLIFKFDPRRIEPSDQFNVVFLVPTGIGAEIGGHAGDAGPAVQLIAQTCDTVVLHPNLVNASDVNEMPGNSL